MKASGITVMESSCDALSSATSAVLYQDTDGFFSMEFCASKATAIGNLRSEPDGLFPCTSADTHLVSIFAEMPHSLLATFTTVSLDL